jgi:nucleoside-diphosphate-sugar epimerase
MVFVTGATGLLGSQLVKQLLKQGEKVCALKRKTSDLSLLRGYENQIEWIEGDVLDIFSLEKGISKCKQVYHAAAVIAFSRAERKYMYQVNVEGTANVVNCCLEAHLEKLIHVSSVAVFGNSKSYNMPINETIECGEDNIRSDYALSKFLGEMEVWRGMAEGLKAVIVNPSIIVGPGWWDGNGPSSIFKIIDSRFPFYTYGTNGYVDVRDVADVMIRLMHSNIVNERYIVSAENLTYREYFNMIADALRVRRPFIPLINSMGILLSMLDALRALATNSQRLLSIEMVRFANSHLLYDSSKLQQQLQFTFRPIRQTVSETAQKYLECKINGQRAGSFD